MILYVFFLVYFIVITNIKFLGKDGRFKPRLLEPAWEEDAVGAEFDEEKVFE